MRWGIITLTVGGAELADRIRSHFPEADIHLPEKLEHAGHICIKDKFSDHIAKIFYEYDALIFIMASGIVVRAVAPLLKSKTEDPAVLVLDEKGKFVISLVSGHIGGGNEAARTIASAIGAQPVITTASDVNGLAAVDMLAEKLGCVIDDMAMAKDITAMMVNGEKVALVSDIAFDAPEYFCDDVDNADGVIYITNKKTHNPEKPYVRLTPRNIIIGVGCRKGTGSREIIELIDKLLDENDLDARSVKCFASIDIKKNEYGLLETAGSFKREIMFFTADEIRKVEDRFDASDFVREVTGAGCVSEPCAYLASNKTGRMIINKRAENGITVAIWEEDAL